METATRPRRPLDAVIEALPDAIACGACALALASPAWPGYDILRTVGLLYFVELPLAFIAGFGGVLRVDDRQMSRAAKRGFILMPSIVVALLAWMLLGREALLAVVWLSAGVFYRLLRGIPPRSTRIPGFYIDYAEGDATAPRGGWAATTISVRGRKKRKDGDPPPRAWRVEGGPEEFAAILTVGAWFLILPALAFFDMPAAGATREYAASVGWNQTLVGALVPASKALWAGVLLFGMRVLARLDVGSEGFEPPVRIEDDPVLREIVRKVDRGK